jgi:para-nitrobenzyl esterase
MDTSCRVVDGSVMPRTIGAAFRDGDVPSVPMLAGYNADEGTLFYDSFQSPTVLRAQITGSLAEREAALAEVFGRNPAKALQALYGMDTIETWDKGATDMLGDDLFGVHMRFIARQKCAVRRAHLPLPVHPRAAIAQPDHRRLPCRRNLVRL